MSIGASYLEPDFIICVSLASHSVSDRIDHINLKKVGWSSVGIVQSLLLAVMKSVDLHQNINCEYLLSLLVASSPAMTDIISAHNDLIGFL